MASLTCNSKLKGQSYENDITCHLLDRGACNSAAQTNAERNKCAVQFQQRVTETTSDFIKNHQADKPGSRGIKMRATCGCCVYNINGQSTRVHNTGTCSAVKISGVNAPYYKDNSC